MSRGSIAIVLATAGVALLLMACQSSPEPAEQPSQTGSEWQDAPSSSSGSGSSTSSTSRRLDLQTVYFDFDRFEIRDDARPALRANADGLAKIEGRVTIEGHCDERGSTEYNLALGERRANAAKRYLVDLGVPSSKLRTVSFGEDRPAVQGHDESAWRYNRRADFKVSR